MYSQPRGRPPSKEPSCCYALAKSFSKKSPKEKQLKQNAKSKSQGKREIEKNYEEKPGHYVRQIIRNIQKTNRYLPLVLTSVYAFEPGRKDCDICLMDREDYRKMMKVLNLVDILASQAIKKEQMNIFEETEPRREQEKKNENQKNDKLSFRFSVFCEKCVPNHSLKCILITLQNHLAYLIVQIAYVKTKQGENEAKYKHINVSLNELQAIRYECTALTDKVIALLKGAEAADARKRDVGVCIGCVKQDLSECNERLESVLQAGSNMVLVMRNDRPGQCCRRDYAHIHAQADGQPIVLKYQQPFIKPNETERPQRSPDCLMPFIRKSEKNRPAASIRTLPGSRFVKPGNHELSDESEDEPVREFKDPFVDQPGPRSSYQPSILRSSFPGDRGEYPIIRKRDDEDESVKPNDEFDHIKKPEPSSAYMAQMDLNNEESSVVKTTPGVEPEEKASPQIDNLPHNTSSDTLGSHKSYRKLNENPPRSSTKTLSKDGSEITIGIYDQFKSEMDPTKLKDAGNTPSTHSKSSSRGGSTRKLPETKSKLEETSRDYSTYTESSDDNDTASKGTKSGDKNNNYGKRPIHVSFVESKEDSTFGSSSATSGSLPSYLLEAKKAEKKEAPFAKQGDTPLYLVAMDSIVINKSKKSQVSVKEESIYDPQPPDTAVINAYKRFLQDPEFQTDATEGYDKKNKREQSKSARKKKTKTTKNPPTVNLAGPGESVTEDNKVMDLLDFLGRERLLKACPPAECCMQQNLEKEYGGTANIPLRPSLDSLPLGKTDLKFLSEQLGIEIDQETIFLVVEDEVKDQEWEWERKFADDGTNEDKTKWQRAMEPAATSTHSEHPVLTKNSEQPVFPRRSDQPGLPKHLEQPVLSRHLEQPTQPKQSKQPVLPKHLEQPALEKHLEQPALEKHLEQPTQPKQSKQPVLPKHLEQPALEKHLEQPVLSKHSEQPSLPTISEEPSNYSFHHQKTKPEMVEKRSSYVPLIPSIPSMHMTEEEKKESLRKKSVPRIQRHKTMELRYFTVEFPIGIKDRKSKYLPTTLHSKELSVAKGYQKACNENANSEKFQLRNSSISKLVSVASKLNVKLQDSTEAGSLLHAINDMIMFNAIFLDPPKNGIDVELESIWKNPLGNFPKLSVENFDLKMSECRSRSSSKILSTEHIKKDQCKPKLEEHEKGNRKLTASGFGEKGSEVPLQFEIHDPFGKQVLASKCRNKENEHTGKNPKITNYVKTDIGEGDTQKKQLYDTSNNAQILQINKSYIIFKGHKENNIAKIIQNLHSCKNTEREIGVLKRPLGSYIWKNATAKNKKYVRKQDEVPFKRPKTETTITPIHTREELKTKSHNGPASMKPYKSNWSKLRLDNENVKNYIDQHKKQTASSDLTAAFRNLSLKERKRKPFVLRYPSIVYWRFQYQVKLVEKSFVCLKPQLSTIQYPVILYRENSKPELKPLSHTADDFNNAAQTNPLHGFKIISNNKTTLECNLDAGQHTPESRSCNKLNCFDYTGETTVMNEDGFDSVEKCSTLVVVNPLIQTSEEYSVKPSLKHSNKTSDCSYSSNYGSSAGIQPLCERSETRLLDVNCDPIFLFDAQGRPLTDSSGRLLRDIDGRSLTIWDEAGTPIADITGGKIYDCHGRSLSEDDFDPMIPPSTKIRILKTLMSPSGKPMRLYDRKGLPLTSTSGTLLTDAAGNGLIRFGPNGQPLSDIAGGPLFDTEHNRIIT